jgi:hypothetical protein
VCVRVHIVSSFFHASCSPTVPLSLPRTLSPPNQLCVLVGSPCPAWSVASALAHQDTGRLLQALRVLQPSILSARRKHIIANVLLGRQLAPCTPEVEAQLVSKLRAT